MKLYKQNSEYYLVAGGQTFYSDGGQPKLDRLQIETIVDPNAPDMSEWDVEVETIQSGPYYFSSPCTTIKITKIKQPMDFEKFKKAFDESFSKVTPNQFVLKMKVLGYEFIDVPTPITTEEVDKLSDTIIQALNRFGKNYNESSFGLPVLVKSYEMIKMVSLIINTQPKSINATEAKKNTIDFFNISEAMDLIRSESLKGNLRCSFSKGDCTAEHPVALDYMNGLIAMGYGVKPYGPYKITIAWDGLPID